MHPNTERPQKAYQICPAACVPEVCCCFSCHSTWAPKSADCSASRVSPYQASWGRLTGTAGSQKAAHQLVPWNGYLEQYPEAKQSTLSGAQAPAMKHTANRSDRSSNSTFLGTWAAEWFLIKQSAFFLLHLLLVRPSYIQSIKENTNLIQFNKQEIRYNISMKKQKNHKDKENQKIFSNIIVFKRRV